MKTQSNFNTDDYVLRIYNNCYGGGPPRLNAEAKLYFDSLDGHEDQKFILTIEKFGSKCTKEDYQEFGFILWPKEYENCYAADEYDGLESPYVDRAQLLKLLINNHFNNHTTINKETYDQLVETSKKMDIDFKCLEF